MNADFESILEECLAKMRSGVSLEECLAKHPSQAAELARLLLAARGTRSVPHVEVNLTAVQAGRERMLAAFDAQISSRPILAVPVSSGKNSRIIGRIFNLLKNLLIGKDNAGMKLALRLALDMIVIFAIGSVMAVNASAASLPGDTLYGVKRTWENVRLTFALNSGAQQALQNQLTEKRLSEVNSLIKLGRSAIVEFEAQITSITPDAWVVGGFNLQIGPQTVIQGTPQVGEMVWVKAQVQTDGTLLALQMRITTRRLQGSPYPGPNATITPQPPMASHTPYPLHTARATNQPTDGVTHTPWMTQGPYQTPWSTYEPTQHPTWMPSMTPWSTHQPTSMPHMTPWPTQQPTSMPHMTPWPTHQPTSMPHMTPWPTHDHNHNSGPDHCGQNCW